MNNKKAKRRIGIDARFYGPLGKGLGRYTQEVVDHILKMDKENEYVIFLSPDNYDELQVDSSRVKKAMVRVRWYTLKEQLVMPYLILKEKLDLVHFPHFNAAILTPTKFVVTIHDLILTKFPTPRATTLGPFLYRLKNLGYKLVIWTAVKRARKIIAVSQFTKNDIVEQFRVSPERIEVTYEGVAELSDGKDSAFVNKSDDRKTLLSYNINKDFFLYVGNAYPHKNLEKLLEVFEGFREKYPYIQLVLVGKEDYFYQRLKKKAEDLGLWKEEKGESPVIFAGYVEDKDLEVLYKKALAYVFPSLYEGFGLPPLEAMAKGCPVLSSNRASMPEILGEAAVYFNPENDQDFRQSLEKIVSIKEEGKREMIEKGKGQVKKYSWEKCGRRTYNIYQELLGS